MNVNSASDQFRPQWVELGTALAPQVLSPYARLINDVLQGDQTFSIRADEAEEAWRIMDPIALAWRQGQPPLLEYPAGSDGPERSLVTPMNVNAQRSEADR